MKREIVTTDDGSSSLRIPDWKEQYHSKHGAIREAQHVFIKSGLQFWVEQNPGKKRLRILEIGFGTGLNALLTALYAEENTIEIDYEGLEAYPITHEEAKLMNYPQLLDKDAAEQVFYKLHEIAWEKKAVVTPNFTLQKTKILFEEFSKKHEYDLVYFDAFGARVQPKLWEEPLLQKMYDALVSGGVFITYSAKGSVRRTLNSLGFSVQKLPGPPGKREMLRGIK